MSLSQLLRNSRLAAAKKAVAVTVVAGAVGFGIMAKTVDSDGNVVSSTSSSIPASPSSSGATGFASSNPVIKPSSGSSMGASADYSAENCVKNPTVENCNYGTITQKDWDEFLPPNGIVVRDARGNVVFKKCRSLTEGAAAAKAEMDQEKARFDKFTTAINLNTNNYRGGDDSYNGSYECRVQPSAVAPKEEPCPTLKNYTELKDYYRQQYYQMSNELQSKAAKNYDCRGVRDTVMAAADPNWKNDSGVKSQVKSANAASGNRGVQ
jgi:hypothetical protein